MMNPGVCLPWKNFWSFIAPKLKSFNGLKAGVSVADTATRPAGLGTNSKVQVGSKQQRGRFSPEAKATLDPSVTAIEVALLLGRPDI